MKKLFLHITLLILLFPVAMLAHEIRPGYLEINENTDHSLQITWKQPLMGEYGIPLRPSISAGWLTDSVAAMSYTESYLIRRWRIPANHQPLSGQTINIAGLEKTITDVLVQVKFLNEEPFNYLLKPVQPFVKLNLSKPQPPPVWQYIQLGVYHIWLGIDHLLFVLALIIITKGWRRIIKTITAFTLAHSLTLSLAVLGYVNVPSLPVEATIALSIVFLAAEIIKNINGKKTLTSQKPWLVAFTFGLLHGFGFAGALAEVGLPSNQIPLALAFFNLGVEIGQVVFVGVILCMIKLLAVKKDWPVAIKKIPAYAIGSVAVFWTIERITAFWN